jgi:demethoxyubiquinone hydroxylase (CLK1/Coq7/Cat5 family)
MEVSPKISSRGQVHIETEVGKLKEKIRHLERKERNHLANIEDLMRELEKGKSKQTQL